MNTETWEPKEVTGILGPTCICTDCQEDDGGCEDCEACLEDAKTWPSNG